MKGAAIVALALVGGGLLAHFLLADPGYVAIRAGRTLTEMTLPVVGVAATRPARPAAPAADAGAFERVMRRIGTALSGLFTVRRVDPSTAQIVTREEQSLRRQHLDLLLLAARVAAMQPDGAAYSEALAAADDWLVQYFDASAPGVAAARAEIAALSRVNVAPPLPSVGAAAQELQRVMHQGAPAT